MEEKGIFLERFCQDLMTTFIPASQAFALLDIDEGSFVLAMLNFFEDSSDIEAIRIQGAISYISYSLPFLYNISKSRSFLASKS